MKSVTLGTEHGPRQRVRSPGILALYLGFSGCWGAGPTPGLASCPPPGLGCVQHERLRPIQPLGLAFKIKGHSLLDGKRDLFSSGRT